jgi:hypothetical protein
MEFTGDRQVFEREVRKMMLLEEIQTTSLVNARTRKLGRWCWTDSVLRLAGLPLLVNAASIPTREQSVALNDWLKK